MQNLQLKFRKNSGVSSLPFILLLGGIIVTFAIGASLLIFLLTSANLGERLSAEALSAARSGIEDGLLRIVRNKNCPDVSCVSNYSFAVGNTSVTVTICKDTCSGSGKHTIIAVGQSLYNRRKLVAVVETNAATGEVAIESVKDLPI